MSPPKISWHTSSIQCAPWKDSLRLQQRHEKKRKTYSVEVQRSNNKNYTSQIESQQNNFNSIFPGVPTSTPNSQGIPNLEQEYEWGGSSFLPPHLSPAACEVLYSFIQHPSLKRQALSSNPILPIILWTQHLPATPRAHGYAQLGSLSSKIPMGWSWIWLQLFGQEIHGSLVLKWDPELWYPKCG